MKFIFDFGARFFSVVVLILCVSFTLNAQQRDQWDVLWWPESKVVLANGDTVHGALTLYRSQDLIHVQKPDSSIVFFSPVHVKYFVAIEQPSGKKTLFRTLDWDLGRDYSDFKKPTFFEQLNSGKFSLMRREGPWIRNAQRVNSFYSPGNGNGLAQHGYQADGPPGYAQELYYLLLPNGEVMTLRNVRRDLLNVFGKKSKKVRTYVRQHNLDYDRPHRLVAIVNYFNTLN